MIGEGPGWRATSRGSAPSPATGAVNLKSIVHSSAPAAKGVPAAAIAVTGRRRKRQLSASENSAVGTAIGNTFMTNTRRPGRSGWGT